MSTRLVYPAATPLSETPFTKGLSSGMPNFATGRKMSGTWALLNLLVEIDAIAVTDTLAVLGDGVNGIRVTDSLIDELGLCLHVHSRSLYKQLVILVESHGLEWPVDLSVLIPTNSGFEVIAL